MTEEELNEVIKLKNNYELAARFTNEWFHYIYSKNRTRFSDDYFTIKIKPDERELTIHLPTVVDAMRRYTDELYDKYKNKLDELNKEK